MHSLAAQHRRQAEAGQNDLNNSDSAAVLADLTTTVMQNQFQSDLNRIRYIKSRIKRTAAKQAALPKYREWVDSFMKQTGYDDRQEQMFVTLLVWCIDTKVWDQALMMAAYSLELNLCQPRGFDRSLVEVITEELSDSALADAESGIHVAMLEQLLQSVEDQDMSDPIRAKLYKALGMALLTTDPARAESLLEQSLLFNPKSGVKRQLAMLQRQGGKPPLITAGNIQDYSLSATQAGKLAGMSTPTLIRHAKKYPEKLPRLEIPTGKRVLYRFNPRHIRAYMKNHLIKK